MNVGINSATTTKKTMHVNSIYTYSVPETATLKWKKETQQNSIAVEHRHITKYTLKLKLQFD